MAKFTEADWEKIVAATHSGMTVEAFNDIVTNWLATATDKRFKRHYTELVYQPMLELLSYLRANGYKTYIVTGGGQDFVRAFAPTVYGVPLEQVVGTAGKTKLTYAQNGQAELHQGAEILYVDDKTGKPEGIHLVIGRRPSGAFGNSDGDMQMLQWTQAGGGPRLMMLVHHDDAQREYAYGAKSKVGHVQRFAHGRGEEGRVDGDQHQERLAPHVSVRSLIICARADWSRCALGSVDGRSRASTSAGRPGWAVLLPSRRTPPPRTLAPAASFLEYARTHGHAAGAPPATVGVRPLSVGQKTSTVPGSRTQKIS